MLRSWILLCSFVLYVLCAEVTRNANSASEALPPYGGGPSWVTESDKLPAHTVLHLQPNGASTGGLRVFNFGFTSNDIPGTAFSAQTNSTFQDGSTINGIKLTISAHMQPIEGARYQFEVRLNQISQGVFDPFR